MEDLYVIINTKTGRIYKNLASGRLGVFKSESSAERLIDCYVDYDDEDYDIIRYSQAVNTAKTAEEKEDEEIQREILIELSNLRNSILGKFSTIDIKKSYFDMLMELSYQALNGVNVEELERVS